MPVQQALAIAGELPNLFSGEYALVSIQNNRNLYLGWDFS